LLNARTDGPRIFLVSSIFWARNRDFPRQMGTSCGNREPPEYLLAYSGGTKCRFSPIGLHVVRFVDSTLFGTARPRLARPRPRTPPKCCVLMSKLDRPPARRRVRSRTLARRII
jgi:hypothetical protein